MLVHAHVYYSLIWSHVDTWSKMSSPKYLHVSKFITQQTFKTKQVRCGYSGWLHLLLRCAKTEKFRAIMSENWWMCMCIVTFVYTRFSGLFDEDVNFLCCLLKSFTGLLIVSWPAAIHVFIQQPRKTSKQPWNIQQPPAALTLLTLGVEYLWRV